MEVDSGAAAQIRRGARLDAAAGHISGCASNFFDGGGGGVYGSGRVHFVEVESSFEVDADADACCGVPASPTFLARGEDVRRSIRGMTSIPMEGCVLLLSVEGALECGGRPTRM
ncbi:unnamed protein product [Miscanthus lutarioriparius]|uniref:Uncharacterized protein n=1 Tax=Miscanthus lutarioriparius TaxID=422564 RepID=A0A811MH27_9POAL|nr:unnamed protein product [Miscanthus lutarioriparius]